MFFLTTIAFAMRVNLSVAIVAMTDNTTSSNQDIPTYEWNDKSVTLSSFYWGYVVLQVFAGNLGRTYGTKWFLVGAMAINSGAFSSIPFFAEKLGSRGVMGCRIVQGLSQGFFFPSLGVIFGLWAPLPERSRLTTIALSGVAISNILTLPVAGYICGSKYGWPASFYLFGALGFAWIIPWIIFGANSPEEHKTITVEEKAYIQSTLDFVKDRQATQIPWKAILTSPPVWAFVVASCGQNWGYTCLMAEMPTYISKMMKFDIHSNSTWSAAPYVAVFITTWACGFISDFLINAGYMSVTRARKFISTIGLLGSGISLIILAYIPETAVALSIVLLISSVGLCGAIYSGYVVNNIDLSPTFSGILTGIANGSAGIFAISSPLFVQMIITDETNKFQWRIVFLVAAGASIAVNIFYFLFGSSEVQWWDSFGCDDEKEKYTKNSTDVQQQMRQSIK